MMIGMVFASMMLLQAARDSPDSHADAVKREVKALEDQMTGWQGTIVGDHGQVGECKTVRSSGDAQLDGLGCQAMSECTTRLKEMTDRLDGPFETTSERDKLLREAGERMTKCVTARQTELFAKAAEDRVDAAN